jgi:hypothetical protein
MATETCARRQRSLPRLTIDAIEYKQVLDDGFAVIAVPLDGE